MTLRLLLVAWASLIPTVTVARAKQDTSSNPVTARRGPVEARLEISPKSPTLGDPIRLTLEVATEPGVELLLPEFFESLGRFEVRQYRATESVDAEGRDVSTRTCELVVPRSGDHSIPPLLIEFLDRRDGRQLKPDGEPAYELLTERLEFTVDPIDERDLAADFDAPYGTLDPLPEPEPARWPYVVGALVVILALLPLSVRLIREARRRARRRSAFDIAVARLAKLERHGLPDDDASIDRYYVELSTIVRRYLEDRFTLRASDRTTEEFIDEAATSPVLDREQQRKLRDVLASADLVKFAHRVPSRVEIEQSLEQVRSFLEETRENAPLLDVEAGADDAASVDSPPTGEESRR